jgi:CBS domain containing-hemolysin-like protein
VLIALLVSVLCIVANAFFVAAEFAFAKVRPTSLEALSREGDARAERALGMSKHLDAYLSATQLGITLASLALGRLSEPAVESCIRPAKAAVGEVLPQEKVGLTRSELTELVAQGAALQII